MRSIVGQFAKALDAFANQVWTQLVESSCVRLKKHLCWQLGIV